MIRVSETDMQLFNNQLILQVKFEEDLGPICGDNVKKGGHLNTWCFFRKKLVGQGASHSNKLLEEK